MANEDATSGLIGAVGTLLGVFQLRRTRQDQRVEYPQLNCAMAMMAHVMLSPSTGRTIGYEPLDAGQWGISPWTRLYEVADGWVCVEATTKAERAGLIAAFDVIDPTGLPDALRGWAAEEVLGRLRSASVPAERVAGRQGQALLEDPRNVAIGRVDTYRHSQFGSIREIARMIRCPQASPPMAVRPRCWGEHSAELLQELGRTDAEIQALVSAGVVRCG
jgi:crotonobetainyl-CoA:carnitine CoA-transferase CaiB-like acyl-CoA transferase